MPTTEYILLHLRDESLTKNEDFQNLMKTVRNQPGCEKLLWGHSNEDPKKLYWLIDWTTLADHEAFMKLDSYGPFVQHVRTFAGAEGMKMLHFDFEPSVPALVISKEAPLLEILEIDLKAGMGTEQIDAAMVPFQGVMTEKGVKSARGVAKENTNKMVAMIAWPNIEAHMAARESDGFKSTIGAVRDLWEGVTMNHVLLDEI